MPISLLVYARCTAPNPVDKTNEHSLCFLYVFLHSSNLNLLPFTSIHGFGIRVFAQLEPLFVSYIRIILFWYMHYCTVPNRLFICYMNYTCFLVYAFLYSSEPPFLKLLATPSFGICVLFSSEPLLFDVSAGERSFGICVFCTARTYWNISITAFKVLVYEFFARLRTFSNR